MIIENNRLGTRGIWDESEMSNRKNKEVYLALEKYYKYVKAISQAIESILLEGKTVSLASRMGSIRLKKFIPIKKMPDWKMTKRLWEYDEKAKEDKKIIWLTNSHTSGYSVKLIWTPYNCQFANKSMTVCKRTRGFQRRSAVTLKQNSKLIDKIKL